MSGTEQMYANFKTNILSFLKETNGQSPDNESEYVINRLVMCCTHVCMICKNEEDDELSEIRVGKLYGWIYCNNCLNSGNVKRIILGWIEKNNTIPCNWIFASKLFKKSVDNNEGNKTDTDMVCYFKFFRYSRRDAPNPIHEGKIDCFDDEGARIMFNNKIKQYVLGPSL